MNDLLTYISRSTVVTVTSNFGDLTYSRGSLSNLSFFSVPDSSLNTPSLSSFFSSVFSVSFSSFLLSSPLSFPFVPILS